MDMRFKSGATSVANECQETTHREAKSFYKSVKTRCLLGMDSIITIGL